MALPRAADVQFLLSRLRPNAEWGWEGGAANDFTRVVWRDAVQIEPTEAEYAAEQVVVDAEATIEAITRTSQKGRSVGIVGGSAAALTGVDLQAAVEELLFRAGALDVDGKILPLDDWKVI